MLYKLMIGAIIWRILDQYPLFLRLLLKILDPTPDPSLTCLIGVISIKPFIPGVGSSIDTTRVVSESDPPKKNYRTRDVLLIKNILKVLIILIRISNFKVQTLLMLVLSPNTVSCHSTKHTNRA
jgi:hypothetical protein